MRYDYTFGSIGSSPMSAKRIDLTTVEIAYIEDQEESGHTLRVTGTPAEMDAIIQLSAVMEQASLLLDYERQLWQRSSTFRLRARTGNPMWPSFFTDNIRLEYTEPFVAIVGTLPDIPFHGVLAFLPTEHAEAFVAAHSEMGLNAGGDTVHVENMHIMDVPQVDGVPLYHYVQTLERSGMHLYDSVLSADDPVVKACYSAEIYRRQYDVSRSLWDTFNRMTYEELTELSYNFGVVNPDEYMDTRPIAIPNRLYAAWCDEQLKHRAEAAAQKQLYTTDHGGSVMKDYGGKGHRIIHPPKGSGLKFFDQMPKNWRVIDL